MKANRCISRKEHILLSVFAFLAFSFIFLDFTSQTTSFYNYSVSEEQNELQYQANGKSGFRFDISHCARIPAGFHFLTFFIFISIIKTKKYLLSSFLTLFYSLVFIYELFARYNSDWLDGDEFSRKVNFFDEIYGAANGLDSIIAFFISTLLFWQISILLRMLIKTLQRKTDLP